MWRMIYRFWILYLIVLIFGNTYMSKFNFYALNVQIVICVLVSLVVIMLDIEEGKRRKN